MDWLDRLGGETRIRILRLVRAGPVSISDLAEAVGISDNAVRTHVSGLERDGLVRVAGRERSTGGKPARLYELTSAAEELFPKAYALVLTELVATVREDQGADTAEALLRRVGRRLGSRATVAGADEEAGLRSGVALLESIGSEIDVEADGGGWTLRSTGCPLSAVVAESPAVCALAESLLEEATGCRVEERCERAGRPRCSFRVHRRGD